jgi:hypothetical protein
MDFNPTKRALVLVGFKILVLFELSSIDKSWNQFGCG